jgi:hypothetical protein
MPDNVCPDYAGDNISCIWGGKVTCGKEACPRVSRTDIAGACPDYGGHTATCVWGSHLKCSNTVCLKTLRSKTICPTESNVTCPTCGSHYWWSSTPTGSIRHCGCCSSNRVEQSPCRCYNYITCSREKNAGCYARSCWNNG